MKTNGAEMSPFSWWDYFYQHTAHAAMLAVHFCPNLDCCDFIFVRDVLGIVSFSAMLLFYRYIYLSSQAERLLLITNVVFVSVAESKTQIHEILTPSGASSSVTA